MEQQTQDRTDTSVRLSFELADETTVVTVPRELSLGDLLPVVLRRFGAEHIERGVEHEGWVVHGAGGPALDEDRTLAELELADDAVLRLLPRAPGLAPIDYDDIVDGVGEQVRNDSASWTPSATKTMLLVACVTTFLIGLAVLSTGGDVRLRAYLAGAVVVVAMAGAALAARAVADSVIGTLLVGVAVVHAAAAGFLGVGVVLPFAPLPFPLLGAAGAALLTLGLGSFVVADSAVLFASAFLVVLLLTCPVVADAFTPLRTPLILAGSLVLSVLAGFAVPVLARWLSRLPVPLLPVAVAPAPAADDAGGAAEAETPQGDGQADGDSDLVVDAGHAAAVYECGLHVGIGVAAIVLSIALVPGGTWLTAAATALFAVVSLARVRWLRGAVPRWELLASACVAVVCAALRVTLDLAPFYRLPVVWLPAVLVGACLFATANPPVRDRRTAVRARVVDVLGVAALLAMLFVLFVMFRAGASW